MTTEWSDRLAGWWLDEVAGDPSYREEVDPLLGAVIGDERTRLLDIGCGDGRLLGRFGPTVGIDASPALVERARTRGEAMVADAGALPFDDGSFSGVYAVLVLEHLADPAPLLAEAARVVAPGGWLALVVNHPAYTAPGSAPIVDPFDGEVLWRWGSYLDRGWSDEPAGGDLVRFHHRPLGELLSLIAAAGWALERLEERPVGVSSDPLLALQANVPRLLAGRWRRLGQHTGGRAD